MDEQGERLKRFPPPTYRCLGSKTLQTKFKLLRSFFNWPNRSARGVKGRKTGNNHPRQINSVSDKSPKGGMNMNCWRKQPSYWYWLVVLDTWRNPSITSEGQLQWQPLSYSRKKWISPVCSSGENFALAVFNTSNKALIGQIKSSPGGNKGHLHFTPKTITTTNKTIADRHVPVYTSDFKASKTWSHLFISNNNLLWSIEYQNGSLFSQTGGDEDIKLTKCPVLSNTS